MYSDVYTNEGGTAVNNPSAPHDNNVVEGEGFFILNAYILEGCEENEKFLVQNTMNSLFYLQTRTNLCYYNKKIEHYPK